jgi:succinate-acetate transporter protein
VASLAESVGLFAVLSTLAAGSGILAGAFIYGSHGWTEVAGWLLVISAGFARRRSLPQSRRGRESMAP